MDNWSVSHKICMNCGQLLSGHRDKNGLLKMECPKCGLRMVSKQMGRRRENIDVYSPHNTEIDG